MHKIKFGTGGFRGVIADNFTKNNVQLICQAISNIILRKNLKKEVYIGYDNRFMSEDFAMWGAEVFAGNGIRVELCMHSISTPAAMYATKVKDNDYGIMITASHNPYMHNGVKVLVKGGKDAGVEETDEIEQEIDLVKNIKYCKNSRLITNSDYNDSYVGSIIKLLDLKEADNNLNIIFDSKFGSTSDEIKLFCSKIGLKNYTIINEKRDAFFNFVAPAPSVDNINELKTEVLNKHANIGFALDADGDRLAVVDEQGNYIDNNYILAIVYYFLVKYCGKTGNSVKNVATSNLLNVVTEKLGYTCFEVPVGFKWVFKGLNEHNAIIGGESSGGLAIHGHVGGKDSLLAIALCLKAMIVMNKSFGEIYQEVIGFADNYQKIILDKQYSYTNEQKQFIFSKLKSKELPQQRYELNNVVFKDYVKLYYKNGNWVLIRFSGTEQILRIFAEADTENESKQLIVDWEKFLNLT